MSNDDGAGSEMFTRREDFRAKINAVLEERRISFSRACHAAGLCPDNVKQALAEGTYGLPGTINMLQQFLATLGLDIAWLVTGFDKPANDDASKRLKLRRLVWDYILNDEEFPWEHRGPFIDYVVSLLDARPRSTVRLAARPGVPRTKLEVGYLYQRLRSEGHF